jgi:cytoskeletal protein CcmA (bactofilin family)
VRATVFAQDVVVLGRLEGEVRASGLVNLRGSAIVQGDVFTSRLSIEDGAQLRGNADPSKAGDPAPPPAKAAVVEPQVAAASA